MTITRVAMLTAGGYAPCLSSAVGGLIERYTELMPQVELIGYKHGYHGLLTGTKVVIDEETRRNAAVLHRFGGSPIGNSRVKLTNAADLVRRGLVSGGGARARSGQRAVDPAQVAGADHRGSGG